MQDNKTNSKIIWSEVYTGAIGYIIKNNLTDILFEEFPELDIQREAVLTRDLMLADIEESFLDSDRHLINMINSGDINKTEDLIEHIARKYEDKDGTATIALAIKDMSLYKVVRVEVCHNA